MGPQPPTLALDMSVLSVTSATPSPIAAPLPAIAHHHAAGGAGGPLTPVSPPLPHPDTAMGGASPSPIHAPGTASLLNPRKRSLTMAEADDTGGEDMDDGDVNLHFECASPVEGEHDHHESRLSLPSASASTSASGSTPAQAKPVGAKPATSNNFVAKLYQ
jgi:hypothetical protein